MTARIERLVTSGRFSLDGGTWDVDNNVWIVGTTTRPSSSTPPTTPTPSPRRWATGA